MRRCASISVGQATRALMEGEEDPHLAHEHVSVDRLEDDVDRAAVVAAEEAFVRLGHRGEKEDRDLARPRIFASEPGDLEAVDVGHLNVEEDRRKSCFNRWRRASPPEPAFTMLQSRPRRTASTATRFDGTSSTTSTLGREVRAASGSSIPLD